MADFDPPKHKTSFRIKTIISGIGMSRDLCEKGYADMANESRARDVATELREKGFSVEVYKIETTETRIF